MFTNTNMDNKIMYNCLHNFCVQVTNMEKPEDRLKSLTSMLMLISSFLSPENDDEKTVTHELFSTINVLLNDINYLSSGHYPYPNHCHHHHHDDEVDYDHVDDDDDSEISESSSDLDNSVVDTLDEEDEDSDDDVVTGQDNVTTTVVTGQSVITTTTLA